MRKNALLIVGLVAAFVLVAAGVGVASALDGDGTYAPKGRPPVQSQNLAPESAPGTQHTYPAGGPVLTPPPLPAG